MGSTDASPNVLQLSPLAPLSGRRPLCALSANVSLEARFNQLAQKINFGLRGFELDGCQQSDLALDDGKANKKVTIARGLAQASQNEQGLYLSSSSNDSTFTEDEEEKGSVTIDTGKKESLGGGLNGTQKKKTNEDNRRLAWPVHDASVECAISTPSSPFDGYVPHHTLDKRAKAMDSIVSSPSHRDAELSRTVKKILRDVANDTCFKVMGPHEIQVRTLGIPVNPVNLFFVIDFTRRAWLLSKMLRLF